MINCDCNNFKTEEQIFKNGIKHIRKSCLDCNKFLGYVPQKIDINTYTLHFGKYKGYKLSDLPKSYIMWLYEQDWIKLNLKNALNSLME